MRLCPIHVWEWVIYLALNQSFETPGECMHTCFFGSAFALSRAFLTRSSWCILCCSIFSSRNFNLRSFSFAYNSHRNSVNISKSTLIILGFFMHYTMYFPSLYVLHSSLIFIQLQADWKTARILRLMRSKVI